MMRQKNVHCMCILFSFMLLVFSTSNSLSLDNRVDDFVRQARQTSNVTLEIIGTHVLQTKSQNDTTFKNDGMKKVEQLGVVLKKKVEMLLIQSSTKLEIVFLIDASSSVGDQNFISELKFIKKLLADFSISQNETRVAVITFSDPDKVLRHVDHISVPSSELHKCNMIHQDLPNIKYSGGVTYTMGALIEAQSVLEWSRIGAQKAVFLITDGFSNGGDPVPVAQILKENGTFIFTFGIQSGNIDELENIASSPKEEFSYLVDSFDQFEAVGRRALHQDLTPGSYQPLNDVSLCQSICPDSEKGDNGCCDLHAHCSCGTGSGHYRCLCNPGFYGSGLRNSCQSCPSGTYHDGQRPGDVSACIACPDPNHITVIGNASSKSSCICQKGFFAKGDFCEVITCPVLYPPENGYFVKGGMCQNVFNAACGMRCRLGYTLHGSSIRLCQESGTWSGKSPKCVVKMCPIPEKPLNGSVRCSLEPSGLNDSLNPIFPRNMSLANLYAVDTECQFTCNPGHIIIGSRKRTCLPLARWDGLRTVCKPVTCRPLAKIAYGKVVPSSCTESAKLPFGQKCDISCEEGYRLVGPTSRKCGGKGGLWTMKATPSKCIDEQPPIINCPDNIVVTTDFGEGFATVTIPQPSVYDNSGQRPVYWSQPTISSPLVIPIGHIQISFIAMDTTHNQAMCNMTVTVLDKEPPVVDSCISPKPFNIFETKGDAAVKWQEPEFHDNSGKISMIDTSPTNRAFPVGKTEISITAYDESGNNSTCVLEVIVEESLCNQHTPNIPNADIMCTYEQENAVNCSVTCKDGFVFDDYVQERNKYFSLQSGTLVFMCKDVQTFDIPQCAEAALPNSISQKGEISFIASGGACNNSELIDKLKYSVEIEFNTKAEEFCMSNNNSSCHIYNTNASCEEIASFGEEETNIIHHVKREINFHTSSFVSINHQPPKQRLQIRDTEAASHHRSTINVQFEVLSQLQNTFPKKKVKSDFLQNNNFSQLKESLAKVTVPLPTNVIMKTLEWKGKDLVLKCSDGSVIHSSGVCVKCPTGTFFSNATFKCLPCPLGEYQNLDGQTKCLPCPKGMSTKYGGSRNANDCLYLCQPGSFGRILVSNPSQNNGAVSPCTLCHPGTYQPNHGATSCLPCPSGLHPLKKGSKSVKDCFQSLGQVGNSWLHSTNCASEMCRNGGSCRALPLGFVSCDCPFGFYGSFCESVYNFCNSAPCLNGAHCIENNLKGYTCKCPSGYTGKNCEEEVDDCSSNPCLNNSTCEDLSDGFFCDCPDGFQGPKCEENIDDCTSKPCGENGICVDSISNYTCLCVNGYSGRNCENEPDDPCLENNSPCLNGATCVTTVSGSYKCICPLGFEGSNCSRKDSCVSSPCLNNGICLKKEQGGHICRCKRYFTGKACETSLLSDFVIYMHSPSVTDYAMVDFPSQNLSKVTACMWLQSQDGFNYGTAFSYATKRQFNSFTLTDYNGFVLYVNGNKVVTDVSTNDGLWHYVCVTWQSNLGLWRIYLDGSLKDFGSMLSSNSKINGGGKFVIGQEQDSFGGSFSEAESLIGRIYRLELWDEILDQATIYQLAKECLQSFEGSVLKWSDFLSNIHGTLKIENSTFCLECPQPDALWHGTVTVAKNGNGSIATYECDNGFVVQKTSLKSVMRHCLKQGYWGGSPPVCVRRSCGFPGNLPGGTFQGNSFLYSDIVKYNCHFGAKLIGNSTRTCLDNGNWSGVLPVCEGNKCPTLSAPKHGKVTMDEKVEGIQRVQFSCENGFYIDGVEVVTCMHDGTWDETVPDCLPILCPSPPRFQNAIQKNTSEVKYSFMDIVHYECDLGYTFTASSSSAIYCNKDGKWCPFVNRATHLNLSLPSCEVQKCMKPDDIFHGRWLIKNGTAIDTHHYSTGTVLIAECDVNFKMHGPKSKNCKDRAWFPLEITQCVKATCDTESLPFDVPHSILHLDGEEVGDTATLSCKDGFQLSKATSGTHTIEEISAMVVPQNSMTWICDSDSSWITKNRDLSSIEEIWLACLPKRVTSILCSRPKAPPFGYILSQDAVKESITGTVIAIHCRTGFRLEGASYMVCGEDGLWHGSAVCKPVKCRSLPHHPKMIVTRTTAVGQDMEFGNLVSFSCIPGFKALGDLSIRCQSTGRWSPLRGSCVSES